MRYVPLALLTILAACGGGGGGPTDPPNVAVVRLMPLGDAPPGVLAYTSWQPGDDTMDVWVVDFFTKDQRRKAVAHELWHVAGFKGHTTDPDCVSFGATSPVETPCLYELGLMSEVEGTFTLMPTPEILDETAWAAKFWNEAVGRTIFVVEAP